MKRMGNERRIKRLLLLMIVLVCAGILAVILMRGVFVLKNVIIEGTTSFSDNDIIRLGKFEFGQSIGKINADRVRENLESSGKLAVDSVTVEKPSTVRISVHERTGIALVLNGGRILLLDANGYVMESLTEAPDSGIYVSGLEATSYKIGKRISAPAKKISAMQTMLEAIQSMNAQEYVSEINLNDLLQISVIARNGTIVKFGDVENMNDKVRWMRSAVADLENRGERGGTLDVSSATRADYQPSGSA